MLEPSEEDVPAVEPLEELGSAAALEPLAELAEVSSELLGELGERFPTVELFEDEAASDDGLVFTAAESVLSAEDGLLETVAAACVSVEAVVEVP